MTEDEKDEQHAIQIRRKMLAEIRRLREVVDYLEAERDEWKDRYEAERADHEATIRNTEKLLAEDCS
jgi:hypothetical protein